MNIIYYKDMLIDLMLCCYILKLNLFYLLLNCIYFI